jgi:hypothetical protein
MNNLTAMLEAKKLSKIVGKNRGNFTIFPFIPPENPLDLSYLEATLIKLCNMGHDYEITIHSRHITRIQIYKKRYTKMLKKLIK